MSIDRKPEMKKLSRAVLDLKFMKKSKEKREILDDTEERQQLYHDQLSMLHEGADRIVMLNSYFDCRKFLPCRLSFGGMDPEIEKLNEDKLTGLYKVIRREVAPSGINITGMQADVDEEEMAGNLLANNMKKKFGIKRKSDHLDLDFKQEESAPVVKQENSRGKPPKPCSRPLLAGPRGRGDSRGRGRGDFQGRGRGDFQGRGRGDFQGRGRGDFRGRGDSRGRGRGDSRGRGRGDSRGRGHGDSLGRGRGDSRGRGRGDFRGRGRGDSRGRGRGDSRGRGRGRGRGGGDFRGRGRGDFHGRDDFKSDGGSQEERDYGGSGESHADYGDSFYVDSSSNYGNDGYDELKPKKRKFLKPESD